MCCVDRLRSQPKAAIKCAVIRLVIQVQVILPTRHTQQYAPHDGEVVEMLGVDSNLRPRTSWQLEFR